MSRILTIARRELDYYFNSALAYVFLIIYFLLTGWFFFLELFFYNQADLRSLFQAMPWTFLIFIPALTMRTIAEERKNGTFEVLVTQPITEAELLLGKFLAIAVFLGIALALTIPLAWSVSRLGDLDWGKTSCGYLGAFLFGLSYASLGIFASCLTRNQIIAFLLGTVLCFLFYLIGEAVGRLETQGVVSEILYYLGLGSHFSSIQRGVIDTRDIIFYLSFSGFFLFSAWKRIQLRG